MVAGVSEAVRAGGDWISEPRAGGLAGAGGGVSSSSLLLPQAASTSEHAAIVRYPRFRFIVESPHGHDTVNARARQIVTRAELCRCPTSNLSGSTSGGRASG